jgi:hypothetical protein
MGNKRDVAQDANERRLGETRQEERTIGKEETMTAREWFEQGVKHTNAGRHALAVASYERVTKLAPDRVVPLFLLSSLLSLLDYSHCFHRSRPCRLGGTTWGRLWRSPSVQSRPYKRSRRVGTQREEAMREDALVNRLVVAASMGDHNPDIFANLGQVLVGTAR